MRAIVALGIIGGAIIGVFIAKAERAMPVGAHMLVSSISGGTIGGLAFDRIKGETEGKVSGGNKSTSKD